MTDRLNYVGDPHRAARLAVPPPTSSSDSPLDDPAGYFADDGLAAAVNLALLLRQPLLVTGEPGCGKTQLAYSVAWQQGLGLPLKFETKSTSVARDLFYAYDTIGRFHAIQSREGSSRAIDYLSYNALGLAILRTRPPEHWDGVLPSHGSADWKPGRAVVLIDEVDKAPRDFPNDILNELELLYFRIPEVANRTVAADRALAPIVILTSNSEKHLPDAFLRRCLYYNIPFPDRARLEDIVCRRLGGLVERSSPLLADVLRYFERIREPSLRLEKKPGTAELLGWISGMVRLGARSTSTLAAARAFAADALPALLKTEHDQKQGRDLLALDTATPKAKPGR